MDLQELLDFIVRFGRVFVLTTNTKIDDAIVDAIEALRDSPAMIQLIERLWKSDIPAGAMSSTNLPGGLYETFSSRGLSGEQITMVVNVIAQAIAAYKLFGRMFGR